MIGHTFIENAKESFLPHLSKGKQSCWDYLDTELLIISLDRQLSLRNNEIYFLHLEMTRAYVAWTQPHQHGHDTLTKDKFLKIHRTHVFDTIRASWHECSYYK